MAGLLDLLAPGSGFAQYADNHSNLLSALGAGIAAGPDLASGFANAAQNIGAARTADKTAAGQIKAKNATVSWLKTQAPDLAQAVEQGLPVSQAFQLAVQRQQDANKSYTLSPGETLYQGGKATYTAPVAPAKPEALPAAIQEYQYAQQQGFKGTLADYQTQMRKAGATSIDFNANQANAAGFANRMSNSDKILSDPKIISAMTDPTNGPKSSIPGVGNYLVGPDFQMAEQAKRDFVNAILRKESGAAISPSEFSNAEKQYFPQPGDTPQVVAQKAANRKIALQGVELGAGPNYQAPDLSGGNKTVLTYNPQTGELE